MLLDLCFKELKEVGLFMLEENEPIVKKIKDNIIGKSSKYPKDKIQMD